MCVAKHTHTHIHKMSSSIKIIYHYSQYSRAGISQSLCVAKSYENDKLHNFVISHLAIH